MYINLSLLSYPLRTLSTSDKTGHPSPRNPPLNTPMLITVVTISLIINYSTNGINTILYPGISRDKIMADLLMYIPNDDSQNYPFLDYN